MLGCLVNRGQVCLVDGTSKKDIHQNRPGLKVSGLLREQGIGEEGWRKGQDACLESRGEWQKRLGYQGGL